MNLRKLRKRISKKLGLRRDRPPFTGRYYRRGRRLLLDAVDIFNAADLPYAVDAGTLLGLVRDGDLIPWDNDIDLMLPIEARSALRQLHWAFRRRGWRISRTYRQSFATDAWRVGDPRVLKIRSWSTILFGPGSTLLDITFIYPHGDYYWWEMAKRVCRAPRAFFEQRATIMYAGRHIKVPHDYENYLTLTYGDWRTPRKVFPHGEFGVVVPSARGSSASR